MVTQSWKISAFASRDRVQAALLAHEDATDWDPDIVLSGCEIAEDRPEEWMLEAWLSRRPTRADKAAVASLFGGASPPLKQERLPDLDWLTLSQQGVEPIRAGRFHVRTPDYPKPHSAELTDFIIPASQAFGTGQHETTAGCLAMLDRMKQSGIVIRNIADIGTGTGLLAFAAIALWRRALTTVSDIDDVCAQVVADNGRLNAVPPGAGAGEVTMVIADGLAHPVLAARAPYDLLTANILAGPLIELAEDFAGAVVPGGHILLSGLLTSQEAAVRAAYRRAGFRLASRMVNGDWSVLWMRKRTGTRARTIRSAGLPHWAARW